MTSHPTPSFPPSPESIIPPPNNQIIQNVTRKRKKKHHFPKFEQGKITQVSERRGRGKTEISSGMCALPAHSTGIDGQGRRAG